jgi:hypothetical protein
VRAAESNHGNLPIPQKQASTVTLVRLPVSHDGGKQKEKLTPQKKLNYDKALYM